MSRIRSYVAAAALSTCATVASAAGFSGLFIFGDSLSDAGNVAAVGGIDAGQVVTGNSYIPSAAYASGQFTNGNVWSASFGAALGLSATPSATGGSNYAWGGARVTAPGGGPLGIPYSLQTQSSQFLGSHGGVASATALYVIEGGGNDARDAFTQAAMASTPAAQQAIIASAAASFAQGIGSIVDSLQSAGAIDIVVWDVPRLALAPAIRTLGAGATGLADVLVGSMNSALASRLSFETGVRTFDVFGFTSAVAANPAAYGITNVTSACGAPSLGCNAATALFWDGIHPTAAGHALLAQGMLAAVPEPQTWAMLAGGLLVLVGLRSRRGSDVVKVD